MTQTQLDKTRQDLEESMSQFLLSMRNMLDLLRHEQELRRDIIKTLERLEAKLDTTLDSIPRTENLDRH